MADTLPNNVDAERALLACLLTDPKSLISICISTKLKPSDFYSKTNAMIYKAILDLYNNNRLVDEITVSDELSKTVNLDSIGGMNMIYELITSILGTSGFIEYLKVVKEKSALRNIISMCDKSKNTAMAQGDSESILGGLRLDFYNFLNSDVIDSGGCTLEDAYGNLVEEIEGGGLKPICMTGFKKLDDVVGGFTETSVWVIGARSSHGKSTFALNLLMNAVKQQTKVCLFTIEVNRGEIAQKVASLIGGIPSQAYKGESTDELLSVIKTAGESKKEMLKRFVIFDKINRFEHICNEIYAQAGQGVKLFCVDHILLIKGEKKGGSSARDLGDIVNGFKQIAQELNVCIILISQFNREQDKRMDTTPRMSDFNGSSDIENIANVALALQRPEFLDRETLETGVLNVYVLKNRGGVLPPTELALGCDMATSQIFNEPKNLQQIITQVSTSIEEFDYDSIETGD